VPEDAVERSPGAKRATDGLRILDPSSADGHRSWLQAWIESAHREPSAHPSYALLMAGQREVPRCACWGEGDSSVLYPFLLRELPRLPGTNESGSDLITPYGYGGAYASTSSRSAATQFWDEMETWLKRNSVVASFARLSLFPEQILPFRGEVEMNRLNVVRSLGVDRDVRWMDYAHKVRKNVNRARSTGLQVSISREADLVPEVAYVYSETMKRRKADPFHHRPLDFFERLQVELRDSAVWVVVRRSGQPVSAELILHSRDTAYSFLGGTVDEGFEVRANDLLKHCAFEWATDFGLCRFVLGGGARPDDGIFRYKKAFAPHGAVPFYIGRAVHDRSKYERLVSRYRETMGAATSSGSFPEYRG
jgi:hypothetical protein